MAYVNANYAFDMRSIDFSWYWENWYEGWNSENSYRMVDGRTFEDTSVINGYDGSIDYGLQYSGTMAFDDSGWATSGTVGVIVEFMWDQSWDPADPAWEATDVWWAIGDIGMSAVDLEMAIKTARVSDEYALIAAALSGDDEVNLSNEKDYFKSMGGNDLLFGWGGNDKLWGGIGDDDIFGQDGNDTLSGDAGIDGIVGGAGKDKLKGGGDADFFVFTDLMDSGNSAKSADIILDFKHRTDVIDVSLIDASDLLGGDEAFVWRGSKGISTDAAGEISSKKFNRPGSDNDYTMILFDMDGDKASEFQVKLTGLVTLSADDFVL